MVQSRQGAAADTAIHFTADVLNPEPAAILRHERFFVEFRLRNHDRLRLGNQLAAGQVIVDVIGDFATATDSMGQQARLDGIAQGEHAGSFFDLPAVVGLHHATVGEPFARHVRQVGALTDGR